MQAASPRPAVSESPKATSLIGLAPSLVDCWPFAAPNSAANATSATSINLPSLSTIDPELPYDSTMNERTHPAAQSGRDSDAIRIQNVNLALGSGAARVHILKDISLRIARGKTVGLVGPSGSGKSTLLMVMAGLERPDGGEVTVDGTPFSKMSEDALARFRGRNVGIVFQSFHLIPTMTALENVAVPLELAGHSDAQQRAAQELAVRRPCRSTAPLSDAAVRRRAAARCAGARAGAGSVDPAGR